MPFRDNLSHLYEHLPAFMRRDDEGLFLRRFVSFFARELDGFDRAVDGLHALVAPETAPEEFLDWWLWALFGWGWFPRWMTLAQKRQFYADVARHYARRGTARGIREFLAAFGITARVFNRPAFYDGGYTTDDDGWLVDTPLVTVVQIFPQSGALPEDLTFYDGEYTTDESAVSDPALVPGRADVDALLRFQQPAGHVFIIEEKV